MPVFIALGSNVEPRQLFLIQAIDRLKTIGNIVKIAPLYESEAYGETEQQAFLNSAILLETALTPQALLASLKRIEKILGRQKRYRWGPREIDLDIIFYDQQIVSQNDLEIPHPDYRNRRFVLQPLVDLNAHFVAPDSKKTLFQLLKECHDETRIQQLKLEWC